MAMAADCGSEDPRTPAATVVTPTATPTHTSPSSHLRMAPDTPTTGSMVASLMITVILAQAAMCN